MAVDPNIPSVPSTVPTDQAPWFTAVKGCIEILMGQGRNTDANRALRVSEYRAGITKLQESLPEYIFEQSMDIPAPPTNLIITKGVWSHHLTWDNPTDEIVSHIEIWVATNSQDRSNAVIRGIVTVTENLRGNKGSFDFSGLDVTDDLVYWIRSISYAGNHSTWEPPDDQGGYVVPGSETIQEAIDKIMDALHGSITENELYQDLNTRIDLIDNPGTGLIDRVGDNSAAIQSEETARTTADSALAQQINTVQSTVGNHTTSIQTNATSIDGVKGKYSVKIDNNGYITGYGLLSTNNNSNPTSEFIMLVDKFKIVSPGITPQIPFAVGRVDGTWTVGINGNLVVDGTILARHIKSKEITADKIATGTLTADKIAAKTITADKIATGTITAAKIAAKTITADKIAAKTITAAKIAAKTITADKIAAKTITAASGIIDDLAVDTLQIAGKAVTNPVGNERVTPLKVTQHDVGAIPYLNETINTKGGFVYIHVGMSVDFDHLPEAFTSIRVYRDGKTLWQVRRGKLGDSTSYTGINFFYDKPSAGTYTYTIDVYRGSSNSYGVTIHNARIFLLETVR